MTYEQNWIVDSLLLGHKFKIVAKRDFGNGPGYLIKGKYVKHGYVVILRGCNVMPAATWFQTVEDAYNAILVYVSVKFDAQKFWRVWYERKAA